MKHLAGAGELGVVEVGGEEGVVFGAVAGDDAGVAVEAEDHGAAFEGAEHQGEAALRRRWAAVSLPLPVRSR